MSSGHGCGLAVAAVPIATRSDDTEMANSKRKTALDGPGLRTLTPGAGPAVLTALADAQSTHRLEVSCLVNTAHATSTMTDVSRLLFDEGADVIEADALLDGDYMSMFYLLKPSACGPRSWKALLSKVNATVPAVSSDAAPHKACTCQVHNVSVEAESESICLRTVWDALHDRGLQVLSCSMQSHRSRVEASTADPCGSAFTSPPAPKSARAGAGSDMSFLVMDLLQQLSGAERQTAVAESVVNACRLRDATSCSVGITESTSNARTASQRLSSGHCFCQQRRQPSGLSAMLYPESYLEPRADGRKRFIPADRDENTEPAAVELFVDDTICKTSTCIEIECRNRKGLMFDVLRTASAAGLRVMQARGSLTPQGQATLQLFLVDHQQQPIADHSLLRAVLHQLRSAVAQPLSIAVVPSNEGMLDVLVITPLDAGRRGRPCVARDVADVLSAQPLRIDTVFVGAVGDCADQGGLPGDVLHEMMSCLQFPQLQRHDRDPLMLSWIEEVNNRLLVYTPRITDSPLLSPCANEGAGKDAAAHASACRSGSAGAGPARAPSGPPAAPSCDARSAESEEPGTVPMLHDLEQHFCSAFLDDDFIPGGERAAPSPAQRPVPPEPAANGAAAADSARSLRDAAPVGREGGRRLGLGKQESNLETGLSFFGPATADSHIPEELGQMMEMHHFIVAGDERQVGSGCSSLAALRSQLLDKLLGVPALR
eukprot:jgi/Ulvmu1/536/UM001_0544.1